MVSVWRSHGVLVLLCYWYDIGMAWGWYGIDFGIGVVLIWYWCGIGMVLVSYWHSIDLLSVRCRYSFGIVLV